MPRTCPTCNGLRRIQRDVRRAWWQVVLLRPAIVDELCGDCDGTGVVKGSPEEEQELEQQRQRYREQIEQRRRRSEASEQARLGRIARTDMDYRVREAAVKKVTDQAVLAEIVRAGARYSPDSKFRGVRLAAVKKLTDQAVLAEVAKTDGGSDVRFAAVEGLTDRPVLEEIARTDEDYRVSSAAARKLTDAAVLAEIARTGKNSTLRLALVKQLTDHAALAEIARTDEDYRVRKAAAEKLTDQDVLAEIARNDADLAVRSAAATLIADASVRVQIAQLIDEALNDVVQDAVRQLVQLYRVAPGQDFYKDSAAAAPVREIGDRLAELGGFRLMLEAHKEFARRMPRSARNLEINWDGIGGWAG